MEEAAIHACTLCPFWLGESLGYDLFIISMGELGGSWWGKPEKKKSLYLLEVEEPVMLSFVGLLLD